MTRATLLVIAVCVGIALPNGGVRAQTGHSTVVVNAEANGHGTARTIQQGIDMVAEGGRVLVRPGTYEEQLVITKGVTVESIADASGPVVISPAGTPASVIEIQTSSPVTLRDLALHVPGGAGIRGVGEVDVTVERASVVGVNPPLGVASNLIIVIDDAPDESRARLVVRDSFVDGTITDPPVTQSFGLVARGNVDALLERNVIRRVGGACIFVVTRADLGGETNVDILENDLDECHPLGRVASILVGPVATNLPSPTRPLTASGVVNIIGNTIRNSSRNCLNNAIAYEVYTGRIEHNRILDVVQPCAVPTIRGIPSAIWIGRLTPVFPFPPVSPSVRFNDIEGNAQAGLRIAANQTVSIDASCNYWGSESGPSGIGPGSGDAIVVQPGGSAPIFMPFSPSPVAGAVAAACER
jgi:hypothetical protein